MNELAEKLFAAVQGGQEDIATDVVLEICERPPGAVLAWSVCRAWKSSARFRALTYAHAIGRTDAISRACLFEPMRESADPSTLINSLELIGDHSSEPRLRTEASRLILRSLTSEDALADAGLDALSACSQDTSLGFSGSTEIAAALRSRQWPEEFSEQVEDVLAFLDRNEHGVHKTDTGELELAAMFLEPYGRGKSPLARCVRDACEVLAKRKKQEELRNTAIDCKNPLHILRIGKAITKPPLKIVTAVSAAWERFLKDLGTFAEAGEPSVTAIATAPGSFELTLSVAAKEKSEEFSQRLADALAEPEIFPQLATSMTEVSSAARKSERLQIIVISPARADWYEETYLDKASAARQEELLRPMSRPLTSMDVPQADSVERVLKAIELTAKGNLSAETLGLTTPRQVDYYKHAGRLLGMLDDENELTSTGKQLLRVSVDERYTMMATLFEVSKCGEAWIAWAKVRRLPEVPSGTATAFLAGTTSGLSENTSGRRARTLEAWLAELGPKHYSACRT